MLNYNFSTGGSTPFGDNLLNKTTTTDGNGNKSISFTDKKGRMLLSRKTNSSEDMGTRADTYYIYDDKDRLVRVIPPGASWNDSELVFTYQYTNNDLISQKKVPGKAYEAFEYNNRDLPVKYQDPILRANSNRWMDSKYDDYGRLTQTRQNLNSGGDKIISELSYTDKDQLAWKKIGNGLQQIDYSYLQNGLLSSINGASALSGSTFPVSNMLTGFSTPTFPATTDDLFRQVLEYNSLTGGLSGTSQNSGNIGQMIWQVKGRAA